MIIIRIWHKSLLPYLPRQQLLGQWRECCCIAKNIAEKGTPNHILVNRIMDYPVTHWEAYCSLVILAMRYREYKIDTEKLYQWNRIIIVENKLPQDNNGGLIHSKDIFKNWHNNNYLQQCFFNLQEKYQCGGISKEEWNTFIEGYKKILGEYYDIFRQRRDYKTQVLS